MQNARSNGIGRQAWLNRYRIFAVIALSIVMVTTTLTGVMSTLTFFRSFQPITTVQATKVEQAATFLRDAGFGDPTYQGITPGVEGQYPTFEVTAIGGKRVDMWIRTTSNGGWEIQPSGVFQDVKSADDFARMAQTAVYDWEHIPADIKPRTDGSYGEYESRKYDYDRLKDYAPADSYKYGAANETDGWPHK